MQKQIVLDYIESKKEARVKKHRADIKAHGECKSLTNAEYYRVHYYIS